MIKRRDAIVGGNLRDGPPRAPLLFAEVETAAKLEYLDYVTDCRVLDETQKFYQRISFSLSLSLLSPR